MRDSAQECGGERFKNRPLTNVQSPQRRAEPRLLSCQPMRRSRLGENKRQYLQQSLCNAVPSGALLLGGTADVSSPPPHRPGAYSSRGLSAHTSTRLHRLQSLDPTLALQFQLITCCERGDVTASQYEGVKVSKAYSRALFKMFLTVALRAQCTAT